MLHSVDFRSLVDLENKSCVRVSLVNVYRQSDDGGFEYFHVLKKKPFKCLVKVFSSETAHKPFEGLFLDHRDNSDSTRTQAM